MGKKKDIREREFVYAQADGWEALYVDGKCVEQYHDVDLIEWLQKYGLNIRREYVNDEPEICEGGMFPKTLSKVKKRK